MDIPNLSTQPAPVNSTVSSKLSIPIIVIIVFVALAVGFWLSRVTSGSNTSVANSSSNNSSQLVQSTDNLSADKVEVGKVYGSTDSKFSDSATGVVQKGGINGEGTHTLVREGVNQNAALTSSVVDLDLFVGKKVDIKGQTNSSRKAGWLLDVGNIKIVQ